MSGTKLGKLLGGIAALLALSGWMLARRVPAPLDPPEPTPAQLRALSVVRQPQHSVALDAVAKQCSCQAQAVQVHLVQRTPRGPLVLATHDADSDDPQPTHWLLPWPGVVQALAQPLKAPCLTESRYLGTTYRHQLLPVDAQGERVLVITTAPPARNGRPLVAIACWAASLAVLVASLAVSRAGGED